MLIPIRPEYIEDGSKQGHTWIVHARNPKHVGVHAGPLHGEDNQGPGKQPKMPMKEENTRENLGSA